jgi:pimeloyl-ACP methyl ester carboxylesterase
MRFVLESGRRVGVNLTSTRAVWPASESGRVEDRRLVVFCHGAPGGGSFDPDPAETRARDVTLLSVDRPGYGRSDPLSSDQWSTVGSAADDIAVVLDSLHIGQVGVVGWSAGGRVALALAARRPDLVDRVVIAATPAPDQDVPWMDPAERAELARLETLEPAEAHGELESRLGSLVPEDQLSTEALSLLGAGTADERVTRDPHVHRRLGEVVSAAFAQGAGGLAADIAGYCLQPWGFEPEAVNANTLLLYGSRDPIAGPRHGQWWEERLPDARLEIVPGAGHLLLIPMWSLALSHLGADRGGLRVLAGHGARRTASDFDGFPAA